MDAKSDFPLLLRATEGSAAVIIPPHPPLAKGGKWKERHSSLRKGGKWEERHSSLQTEGQEERNIPPFTKRVQVGRNIPPFSKGGSGGIRSHKAVLIGVLSAFILTGQVRSATTANTAVSVSIASFCLVAVTSSSISLTITNPATPGGVPSNANSSSTYAQYSSTVASGVTRRVTAVWATGNSAPTGCELRLTATPGTGQGTSAGQILVSTTAQNIVTGIGGCATGTGATSGAQLGYALNILTMTSLVANESKSATITLTLTDS